MRSLILIAFCASACFAQVTDGITTLASRTVSVSADECDFAAIVSTDIGTTRDGVTQAFLDAGIENITVTGVAAGINQSVYPPPQSAAFYYQIAFTTAPAAMAAYARKLDALRAKLPDGFQSLQYSAALNASQSAVDAAHQSALPQLLRDARTKALALADAANLKLGVITGISESSNAISGYFLSSSAYVSIPGINSFSSGGGPVGTQFTFYATVKFAVQ